MALTGVDKIKLNKYIREHAIDDIFYIDMCDYLGKRGKISDKEFIDHFTECVINEFSKDVKISVKHAAKLVSLVGNFVGWMHEEKSVISDETLDKIRSFDQLYDDYLKRNVMDCDTEFREHCILEVIEKVNKLYPSEVNTDSVAKYIVKVRELEGKVKELERLLEEAKREVGVFESDLEKSNSKVDSLIDELGTVRDELRSKKDYVKELEKTLCELREQISLLETNLGNVTSERDELAPYKSQFEELSGEVTRLGKIVSDYKTAEKKKNKQDKKDARLKEIIYQKLLVESASLDDLLSVIQSNGITSDMSEVSRLLSEMRKDINITNGTFTRKPTYKVVKPRLMANGKFMIDVPSECKHMDVMLVSDFHIKEFDKKTLEGFDMLNDYCAKNGIGLILNLGDFYNGFSSRPIDYTNAVNNRKIVEESIDVIPKADGIYHAVLGGNHERNMSNYGFDPLKMLTDERDDFIDLGYYHSTICLDGVMGNIGKFDLHHPSEFNFPVDLDEDGLTVDDMNDYLEEVYTNIGRSRDDSYIDIFGHTHRNQFNYASSYCYIPPYFEGKNRRGACHLRIYFDEDTGIKYMVFMPLSVSTKLTKNNEIVYQKVISR